MGEDYSTFPLLIDGKKVECVSVSEMSFSSEEEEWHDENSKTYTLTFEGKVNKEDLSKPLKLIASSRKFTKAEKKLFIRTVEAHGRVEFILKNVQVQTPLGLGKVIFTCTTPKGVRMILRSRKMGECTYRIIKRLR